jgi:hypothetical protein
MGYVEDKRIHDTIELVGMRQQATTVGLVQLAIELRQAGVLEEAAVERIKCAIANEICLSRPKSIPRDHYQDNLRARLDRLFAGEERVGEATALQG